VIKLSKRWCQQLISQPETGMGYQVTSVTLQDGRRYDHVLVDSGYITRIKDLAGIPFAEAEIVEIVVTHDKWDFNADRRRS
jgi:hypothetical protein